MAAQTELSILIRVKDEATAAMQKLTGSLHSAEGASKAFAVGLLGAGAVAVGFGVLAVKAAADAEAQMAKVDAIVKTMGGSFDQVKASIVEASKATVKLGFDDEEAAASIAKLYQRTGDMTRAIELNSLAMDLARAKNMDLATAGQMVGMVLSGNARVLKQYGIDIKEAATPMEALVDLQGKLKGQAEAYSQTFKGQLEVFHQQFQNLQEDIGVKLLPVLTELIKKVNNFVENDLQKWISKTQEIIKWLKDHKEIVIVVAGAVVGALIPAFIAIATTIITVTIPAFIAAAIALAPFMLAGAVVAGVVLGILWIIRHWELIKSKTIEIFNAIRSYLSDVWNGITGIFQSAVDYIMGKVNAFLDAVNRVKGVASGIGSTISGGMNKALSAIGLAEGGIVMRPTLAVIGEGGEPEAVIPLSKLSGVGGGLTVVLQGTFMTAPEMAREYGRYLADEIKRQMRI